MSYPFIFSSAFGTVISTLGSKYIGARDDRAYLRLGIIMIVISGIIGATLGTVVVFFADDLLNFFTQEQDVIDVIKPVFPIVVPYIAAGTHYALYTLHTLLCTRHAMPCHGLPLVTPLAVPLWCKRRREHIALPPPCLVDGSTQRVQLLCAVL